MQILGNFTFWYAIVILVQSFIIFILSVAFWSRRSQLQVQDSLVKDIPLQEHTELGLPRPFFQEALMPIAKISPQGVLIEANPRLCTVLQMDMESLSDTPIESWLTLDHHDNLSQLLLAGESDPPLTDTTGQLILNEDETRVVNVELTQIQWQGSTHYLLFFKDITELKNIQKHVAELKSQLDAAHKTKSDFLAEMSHEMRTPLNAIMGFSQLLNEDLQGEQKQFTGRILDSGDYLLSVINDTLDYTRMESRKLALKSSEFKMIELINEVVGIFELQAREKKLQLNTDVDPQIPLFLIGDKQRIKQVICNLLGNALKFTEKGSVSVRVKRIKATAKYCRFQVTVEDTGLGIPDNRLNSIFKPFTQVVQEKDGNERGSGLGLSISQKIVSAMGGKIHCSSKLDEGSSFFFELKLKIFEEDLFTIAEQASTSSAKM